MFKKTVKSIITYSIVIYILFIISNNVISTPTITGFDISPKNPKPLSTINLIIGIESNERIDDVRLIVEEYSDSLNYFDKLNLTLNYSYSCCKDIYQLEFNLTHKDATYIRYYIMIHSNNTWYKSEQWTTNLSINKNNYCFCNRAEYPTPGFGFVLIFFSIIIYLYLFKRKF